MFSLVILKEVVVCITEDKGTPDDVMAPLLERWREDWKRDRMAIAEKFQLRVSEAKMKQVLDGDEARVREILAGGLDIGTIIRHIVPVTLKKHPEHGWVFVCTDGRMFRVSNYI